LTGTNLDTVPGEVPYLGADPTRVGTWREGLGQFPGVKGGGVWEGNPRFQWGRHRAFPPRGPAPPAQVAGGTLYSLEKEPGAEQVAALKGCFEVIELPGLDEDGGAFLDTAAVMKNLDLVVTADTAAAHLAGALGVPVWLALSRIADWRWLLVRGDTPW